MRPLKDPELRRTLVLYALVALSLFVFVHSFMPHDPRVKMGFKSFEVEWSLSRKELWHTVRKWRHISWFALFFPLVRSLFREHPTRKALIALVLATFLIELQQTVVAGRHARLADLLPNLIGAAIGALVFGRWSRMRASVPGERRTSEPRRARGSALASRPDERT